MIRPIPVRIPTEFSQHDRVDGGDDGTAPHIDAEPRRTQAEDGRD
jgi:hypothetical protein